MSILGLSGGGQKHINEVLAVINNITSMTKKVFRIEKIRFEHHGKK